MTDDEVPALVRYLGVGVNGLVGKATEALLLLQGADPMVAATMSGSVGEIAKEAVVDAGRRLVRRQHERLAAAFSAAGQESDRTPQQLFEYALDQDDERRLDLFVGAFSAAARESNDRKVPAFGRMAASGILAQDDAKVDETARVFATLAVLDEAALKTLLHLVSEEDQGWQMRTPSNERGLNVFENALPELVPVLEAVVAQLEYLGLVTSRESTSGITAGHTTTYRVTGFARLCVRELLRGDEAGR